MNSLRRKKKIANRTTAFALSSTIGAEITGPKTAPALGPNTPETISVPIVLRMKAMKNDAVAPHRKALIRTRTGSGS
ncbi:MAG: hypothetical protein WKF31_11600 [Thermoleophilaceae bacterium]